MREFPEKIGVWWSNVVLCSPFYQKGKRLLYWLIKLVQIALNIVHGAVIGQIFKKFFETIEVSADPWFHILPIFLRENKRYIVLLFVSSVILIVLWLTKREFSRRKNKLALSNLILRWLFEDLGFNRLDEEKQRKYDFRCTLWSPVDYSNDLKKMVITQIADYCPNVSNSPSIHGNKVYKSSGRRRKVGRIDKNGEFVPIGLVGETIRFALNNHKPEPKIVHINDNVDFINEMVNKWNFLPYEAKKLTNDRRSYYCYPIMPRTCDDILALLYIDSKQPDAFTNKAGRDTMIRQKVIDRYIIRIAKLVEKKRKVNHSSNEGE